MPENMRTGARTGAIVRPARGTKARQDRTAVARNMMAEAKYINLVVSLVEALLVFCGAWCATLRSTSGASID
jgi:hypothetical protein